MMPCLRQALSDSCRQCLTFMRPCARVRPLLPSCMAAADSLYHSKNRIVAVDITRLLAAFAIMTGHLTGLGGELTTSISWLPKIFFGHISSVFLVLAGYFAARNLNWGKALNNAWWSFAPFILWNTVCIGVNAALGTLPGGCTWYSLLGCNSWFIPPFTINPELTGWGGLNTPMDSPLWFMRDLTLLFLISPLLNKNARWLFPAMFVLACLPWCSAWFAQNPQSVLAPSSIAYFTAGCFLRGLSQEFQQKALRFCNIWLILAYLAWALWKWSVPETLPETLLAVWVFYQIARWLELHLAASRNFALRFAPVTFLTFATHWIAFPHLLMKGSNLPLLYPLICFVLMALFFFALKRRARPLLHLVAHYKLRPDDVKTPQGAS